VVVWLWDACGPIRRGCGITDDQGRARQAAEACLRSGHAHDARVEEARVVLGIQTLTTGYRRTGHGWRAQRGARSGITWVPFTTAQD
jgi:hypothetical protein